MQQKFDMNTSKKCNKVLGICKTTIVSKPMLLQSSLLAEIDLIGDQNRVQPDCHILLFVTHSIKRIEAM